MGHRRQFVRIRVPATDIGARIEWRRTVQGAAMANATPHTQVPNLLQDFVYPLLSGAEVACLGYIVRRTYGFAAPTGGRKQTDRISLSQFQHGITTGRYVLDLGTGLSRSAIIGALGKLEHKQLVTVSRVCARCLWDPADDDAAHLPKEMRCPRCGRTCDRTYGLAPLSAKRMLEFLNAYDPKHRRWGFDREAMRFVVLAADAPDVHAPSDVSGREDYERQLWYPELLEQAIRQLEAGMRKGRVSDAQRIKHFYRPVLELQEMDGAGPALVKHALEQTIERGIPGQARERRSGGKVTRQHNFGWHRYAKAIIERERADPAWRRATVREDPAGTGDLRALEASTRELLSRARDLNKRSDAEAARALLSELLGQAAPLAPLCGGDVAWTDALLRLAFKQGQTDFLAARETVSLYDFYPEWTWPADLITPPARRG